MAGLPLPLPDTASRGIQAEAAAEHKKQMAAAAKRKAALARQAAKALAAENKAAEEQAAAARAVTIPVAATAEQWADFTDRLEPLLVDVLEGAARQSGRTSATVDTSALVDDLLARFQAEKPLATISDGLTHVLAEVARTRELVMALPAPGPAASDVLAPVGRLLDHFFSSIPSRMTRIEASLQQLTAATTILTARYGTPFYEQTYPCFCTFLPRTPHALPPCQLTSLLAPFNPRLSRNVRTSDSKTNFDREDASPQDASPVPDASILLSMPT